MLWAVTVAPVNYTYHDMVEVKSPECTYKWAHERTNRLNENTETNNTNISSYLHLLLIVHCYAPNIIEFISIVNVGPLLV